MDSSECQKLLAVLKILTTTKAEQADDIKLTIEVYRTQLEKYPADVVRYVLTTQANLSKWWPTWADLKGRLDSLSSRRLKMMAFIDTQTQGT
jgi:hypothetical protein